MNFSASLFFFLANASRPTCQVASVCHGSRLKWQHILLQLLLQPNDNIAFLRLEKPINIFIHIIIAIQYVGLCNVSRDQNHLRLIYYFTESKPECTTNVTNGSLVAYDWLKVKCSSNITKNGEFSMNCRNLSGSPIDIPGVTTENSISVYVQAGGPLVLQAFVCTVKVTTQSSPVSEGSLASSRTKDYMYDWTSSTVNVCK